MTLVQCTFSHTGLYVCGVREHLLYFCEYGSRDQLNQLSQLLFSFMMSSAKVWLIAGENVKV